MPKCKYCGKKIANGLVSCPSCNSPREEKELQLTSKQIKQIAKQVKKEFYKTLGYWIGILIFIFGLSLYQIWQRAIDKMGDLMVDRINKEFEQPTIRETVKDVAKTTAKELLTDEIQPEVIKFKAKIESNVKEIQKLGNLAQSQVNNLASKIEESDKKIETIDIKLNEASKVNENLKESYNFMITFVKAQSDDSEAYEQLARWGYLDDFKSYPFRDIASNIYESIHRAYLERLIPAFPALKLQTGVDPVNFSSNDFKNYFKSLPPKFHAYLVNLIPDNKKLSDKEKMELLLDVIDPETKTSNSLNAKYFAGNILAEKMGINWQPFYYEPIQNKWEETKGTIPAK